MQRKGRNLKRIFFLVILSFLAVNTAHAGQLRFFTDAEMTESGTSSDPWFNEGFLIDANNFLLDVVNTFTQKSINNVKLVLSVPKSITTGSWSVQLNDGPIWGFNDFLDGNTGSHPYLTGNNAIYKNAYWLEVDLGALAAFDGNVGGSDTASVNVQISQRPSDFLLHFDAYGNTNNPGKVFVPFSHDITVTPEPLGSLLFLLGGTAMTLIGNKIRKRRSQNPAE